MQVFKKIVPKLGQKWVKNGRFVWFFAIGVSANSAEYSVPNTRPILAEYSAEYSVFGRTLEAKKPKTYQTLSKGLEIH